MDWWYRVYVVKRKSVKLGCPYVYVIALYARYVVLYGVDVWA